MRPSAPINTLSLDYKIIFNQLENIKTLVPQEQHAYISQLLQLKGSPLPIYSGLLISSIIAYPAMSLSGAVANKMHHVPHFFRFALASSSVLMGGYLRIWGTQKVERGEGKQAILTLLSISIIGMSGLGMTLPNDSVLAIMTADDPRFWILGICCLLGGASLAVYAPCMALAAEWAPNDSVEEWINKRQIIAQKTNIANIAHFGFAERRLAPVLRKNAAGYMATIGGIGNITPAVTLIFLSSWVPKIGLTYTCASFTLLTALASLGVYSLLEDPPYHQLIKSQVPHQDAVSLAILVGQNYKPVSTDSYQSRIHQLSAHDKYVLLLVCTSYITTLGSLFTIASGGSVTFIQRGMPADEATKMLGLLVGLDAIIRTLVPMLPLPISADALSNSAFLGMAISSLVAATSPKESVWFPALVLFALFNGIGNSSVVTQISTHLPKDISLATGLSSGIGAFSSFFISLMAGKMAAFNQVDTAYEYLAITFLSIFSVVANSYYIYSNHHQTESTEEEQGRLLQDENPQHYNSL